VAIPHFAAYHNPINFKDPDSFIPERWFPETGYDGDCKDVFHPFSVGPRNCIGQK
jgi:cytochrome P450